MTSTESLDRKIIVCDLDGTIADCMHRIGWIKHRPKNYDAFGAGIPHDTPIEQTIWLVREFAKSSFIIMCSGRSDKFRIETEQWLKKHDVPYETLLMRKEGDMRADYIIKEELLQDIRKHYGEPYLAIDDRLSVIEKCWVKNGIYVLNVNQHNINF